VNQVKIDADLLARVRKKRLIFTVTTGRSGTAYLTAVFSYMKDVQALHEPHPEYVEVLRTAQIDRHVADRFVIEKKLPAIASISKPIYVETSHLICKGFLESFLNIGIVPDLVIHRRPPRDISLSLLKMGTIPGRNEKALRFYLQPTDPGVLPLPDWQALTDYQLCYWYCLEIERRAQEYISLFKKKGARVIETTLSGLKTPKGFDELMTELDLKLKFPALLHRMRFMRNSRFKVNESSITKKAVNIPENLDELESQVQQRVVGWSG
jgi:hypothetical protein